MNFSDIKITSSQLLKAINTLENTWDPWSWLAGKVSMLPEQWRATVFSRLIKDLIWASTPPPSYRQEIMQSFQLADLLAKLYLPEHMRKYVTQETYIDFLEAVYVNAQKMEMDTTHEIADTLEKHHEQLMKGMENV